MLAVALLLCFGIFSSSNAVNSPKTASAMNIESSYNTYSLGPEYMFVRTQSAYNPTEIIKLDIDEACSYLSHGEYFIISHSKMVINTPNDIYPDDSKQASVKTGIISITDQRGNELRRLVNEDFGSYVMAEPTGLAMQDDFLYIADRTKQRITILDFNELDILDGSQIPAVRLINKPDNPLFGKNAPFVPVKIIVDRAHNMVITSEGNPNGAVHLDARGEFMGYLGINKTPISFTQILQSIFFSKEQKARLLKKVPASPTNLAINDDGLIYTITTDSFDGSIKMLDTTGTTIFASGFSFFSGTVTADIDQNGLIYAVSKNGYITVYDSEGFVIFTFGGTDNLERFGSLTDPIALSVLDNRDIIIFDKTYKSLIRYSPTSFFLQVAEAINLYKEGLYLEAEPLWEEILKQNSSFIIGYNALARANLKKGNYDLALSQFELSESHGGYSEAFWYIRNEWMQNNILWVLILLAVFVIISIAIKQVHKRTTVFAPVVKLHEKIMSNNIVSQLKFMTYYMFHPKKAIDQMKYKNKLTVLPATILYFVYVAVGVASAFLSGFLFRAQNTYNINLMRTLIMLVLPILLGVVSNYFVSSISDGEGKLKHVYISAIYSMSPYILLSVVQIILSNVLTYNEDIILGMINLLIIGWCVILIITSIANVHFYGFKKTVRNVFVTIFTFLMAILFAIIIYLLATQLFGFLGNFVEELLR